MSRPIRKFVIFLHTRNAQRSHTYLPFHSVDERAVLLRFQEIFKLGSYGILTCEAHCEMVL